MNTLKLIVLYMCFVKAGIAQSRYPVDAIDSLGNKIVIISDAQNKWILQQIGNYEICAEESDSTLSALNDCISLNDEKSKTIKDLVSLSVKQDSIIKKDNVLFSEQKKVFASYENLNKLHLRNEKSLKTKVVLWKGGFALGIGGILAILIFLR